MKQNKSLSDCASVNVYISRAYLHNHSQIIILIPIQCLLRHSSLENQKAELLIIGACVLLYRWYCQFDDDVYVNVPALVDALRELGRDNTTSGDFYFGRWPIEAIVNPRIKNGYPVCKVLRLSVIKVRDY